MTEEYIRMKRSKVEDMHLDIEALNELLRQETGMGQGEIDTRVEELKPQLKKKYAEVVLKNYPDSKCKWGYFTACEDCAKTKQVFHKHVDFSHPITDYYPGDHCEACGKKEKVQ